MKKMPVKPLVVLLSLLVVVAELTIPTLLGQLIFGNMAGLLFGFIIGCSIFVFGFDRLRFAITEAYKSENKVAG
jgi:hypothetical protein